MVKDKQFLEEMIKKYGEDILIKEGLPEGISTSSVSLDASIGCGGIPRSKFTEIYGPEGVAKTTLCLNTAANAIKLGYKVLYIDVENLLDKNYANHLVGTHSKEVFTILQPDKAEDAFNMAEKGIMSGEYALIIFDSIGALAPEKEKEDEFEDMNVALVSRLMSKFIRRNEYLVRINNIAFVFLNQVRANVGSYTQGYTTPGGHALKHISTVIIQLGKGTPIKKGDDQIGTMVTFTTKKNKLAPPFRSYSIPIIFGEGVDTYRDLLSFGESIGVLSKAGPYYKYGEITVGRGVVDSITNLKGDQELYLEIRNKILNSVKKYSIDLTEDI